MSLTARSLIALLAVLALAACEPSPQTPIVEEDTQAQALPSAEPVSILRPDVDAQIEKPDTLAAKSLTATVGFPQGGSDLDADALAVLEEVKGSQQFAQNGAIILRAHSDSAGSDRANERASEARGLAVAEWLIAAGADARRIDVIVFGEQNPAQPNALPDGSSNEAGRAFNRRVEIEILAATPAPPPADNDAQSPSEPGDEL